MLFPAVYWRWKWTLRFLQMCCFFHSWILPWSRFRSCPKSDGESDGGPVMSFVSPLTAPQLFSLLKKPHQYWVLKVGWSVLWNSGTLSHCPPLMIPSNPCSRCCVRDLHSCSIAFYWNSQLWISSFLFFCLQIHLFNTYESSICSSSTRAFHFLQRKEQCLILQPLTSPDFP